jgi:hypothetical protein
MGLIDLKTDLKSLKYGKDRIGGGASQQPFVQKPIPDSFSAVGNTGGLDVLTRGGSLIFQSIADDASRLTKLLLTPDTFQGPAFTIKQNVLSRQNVKTQASPKGLNQGVYLPTSTIAQALVNAEGLHFNTFGKNPIPDSLGSLTTYSDVVEGSLLTPSIKTVGNNRLLKFTRDFVDSPTLGNTLYSYSGGPGSILGVGQTRIKTPVEQRTGINNVNNIYWKQQRGNEGKFIQLENGLKLLNASIEAGLDVYDVDGLNNNNTSFDTILYGVNTPAGSGTLTSLDRIKINPSIGTKNSVILGANSLYAQLNNLTGSLFGFGSLYDDSRSVTPLPLLVETPSQIVAKSGTEALENTQAFTYTQDQLRAAPSYRVDSRITDFRKTLRASLKGGTLKQGELTGALTDAPDYTTQNIEQRVHLGNPGDPLRNLSSYTAGTGLGPLDKINALVLYQSANVAQDSEKDVNDLVKFRIAVLDSSGSSTKTFIHFRAFLDAVSDNYSADWKAHQYVGRGENFYTYSGFDRKVSLSWTVYAQSKEELIPMYKKLNYLASSLAPNYKNGFMRGVLVQLTIGGYFYNQPGFITNLTYEMPTESTWEIGINDKGFQDPVNRGDDRVKELSHMIKVTGFNFTPIHTFIPEVQKNTAGEFVTTTGLGDGPQRYIALNSGYDNNYDS